MFADETYLFIYATNVGNYALKQMKNDNLFCHLLWPRAAQLALKADFKIFGYFTLGSFAFYTKKICVKIPKLK